MYMSQVLFSAGSPLLSRLVLILQEVFHVGERVRCLVMGMDDNFTRISLSTAELEEQNGDMMFRKVCKTHPGGNVTWELARSSHQSRQGYSFDNCQDMRLAVTAVLRQHIWCLNRQVCTACPRTRLVQKHSHVCHSVWSRITGSMGLGVMYLSSDTAFCLHQFHTHRLLDQAECVGCMTCEHPTGND